MSKQFRTFVYALPLVFFLMACGAAATPAPDFPVVATAPAAFAAQPADLPAPTDLPQIAPTTIPPTIASDQPATILDRKALTADQLRCDGTNQAPPCEQRKIRIRGWDDAKLCTKDRVKGEIYSFFPQQAHVSWVTVIHGLPEEGGIGPKGNAYDAGSKFTYDHENDSYFFVTEEGMPPSTFYSIAKSEATCETRSPEQEYYVDIKANWCPYQPDGRYTAIEGQTYTFYGINNMLANNKPVQFSFLIKFQDPDLLISSNADMGVWTMPWDVVARQDFGQYILYKINAPYGVWVQDPITKEKFWAPELFCDWFHDSQP